ncbi:pilus assembly FimT family protein [Desulfobacter vibrioformis]|uniref:pilus assembly FimT family protein n=1 Tax=Desulfobacter vibrioformis TaxID=34031 RepID=UPI000689ECAB|nr:GspH/FimT family pseudopilin [Desulfobacter vibrioformis]
MKPQSGFTMLELLIAVAIIGIAAGLAMPDLIGFMANYRLKDAASRLYSDMQNTKLNAIKQNKDWAIVFNAGAGKYYICSDKGGDNSWDLDQNTIEKEVTIPDKSGVSFGHGSASKDATSAGGTSFSDDDITFNDNYAIFNSAGSGSAGYVYLENNKKTTYAVGMESTGFISIKKWNGSKWQ